MLPLRACLILGITRMISVHQTPEPLTSTLYALMHKIARVMCFKEAILCAL